MKKSLEILPEHKAKLSDDINIILGFGVDYIRLEYDMFLRIVHRLLQIKKIQT